MVARICALMSGIEFFGGLPDWQINQLKLLSFPYISTLTHISCVFYHTPEVQQLHIGLQVIVGAVIDDKLHDKGSRHHMTKQMFSNTKTANYFAKPCKPTEYNLI
jgi:hypothetical protein